MGEDRPESGWALVANRDEAAPLIAALVELDTGEEYTRSELAEVANVPLKTLYLVDTLEDFVAAGMLSRTDDESDDSEACYVLNENSDALAAARRFDEAVAETLAAVEAD